jgi:hypothetical protein
MSIEAMKKALEALELFCEHGTIDRPFERRNALYNAIEQAEKEPVKCTCGYSIGHPLVSKCICTSPKQEISTWAETNDLVCALLRQAHDVLACASYPFKRPWVSLTDEEIKGILDCGRGGLVDIKKAEQILRERNT